MGWNHRVLEHTDNDQVYYMIHEVYYDDKGVPNGYAENGTKVLGDTTMELKWALDRMLDALSKPILSVENFPKESCELNKKD